MLPVFLLLFLSHIPFSPAAATTINNITLPGCPSKCGNLTIPYPFGIESGCSVGPWFDIICNTSFNPPKAFLPADLFFYSGDSRFHRVEVVDISDEHVRVKNLIASTCYDQTGVIIQVNVSGLVVENSFYTLSELNKVIAVGCDDYSFTSPVAGIEGKNFTSGCVSVCSNVNDVSVGSCSGMGCCSTSLPNGLTTYLATVFSLDDHTGIWSFNKCGYTFVGEESAFTFRGASDLADPDFVNRTAETVPVVLNWVIGSRTCNDYKRTSDYYCQQNSVCVDFTSGKRGYRCSCESGYEGNPYLPPGCHDIDECADPNNNPCNGTCTNLPGSFNCSCPHGFEGDGTKDGSGCRSTNSKSPVLKLSLGKKPLSMERSQAERNLAAYFLVSMKTNNLFQILDPRVIREGSLEQLQAIGSLVKRCLSMNGYDRPTMKEVAMELESLRKFTKQPWVNQHGSEDGLSLMSEGEHLDLYNVSINPYTDSIEASSLYSSDQFHSLVQTRRNIVRGHCLAKFGILPIVTFTPLAPYSPVSAILPLIIVIGATMVKEGIEDWQRQQQVEKDEFFPAYLLLLSSSEGRKLKVGDIVKVEKDEDAICYVTVNDQRYALSPQQLLLRDSTL
ncbi:hypothetical protein L2E82_01448 [Cichorium intybus]|uniref:Uncharacterized protein n=1 Tax=Cichorium intybus TaxID=13427 RepID=A0ACB9H0G9_CICIN|nr:hypothetical protein L2E82_01448 [Cichorium intybus]